MRVVPSFKGRRHARKVFLNRVGAGNTLPLPTRARQRRPPVLVGGDHLAALQLEQRAPISGAAVGRKANSSPGFRSPNGSTTLIRRSRAGMRSAIHAEQLLHIRNSGLAVDRSIEHAAAAHVLLSPLPEDRVDME